MTGQIKVLKNWFGFISTADAEGDVFFHASSLEGVAFDDLVEGQELSFEIGEGNNGKKQAVNVTAVEA